MHVVLVVAHLPPLPAPGVIGVADLEYRAGTERISQQFQILSHLSLYTKPISFVNSIG